MELSDSNASTDKVDMTRSNVGLTEPERLKELKERAEVRIYTLLLWVREIIAPSQRMPSKAIHGAH